MHNSAGDPQAESKLLQLVRARGFDCVDVSEPGEADMKEFVKQSIVSRWDSIEKFNARVQDTVVNAMELSQVRALLLYLLNRPVTTLT